MNGYKCFWRGKECEVHADTSFQAQVKAQAVFGRRCKKRYEITVILCEKKGEQVVHSPLG
jgi:hypothetical protein